MENDIRRRQATAERFPNPYTPRAVRLAGILPPPPDENGDVISVASLFYFGGDDDEAATLLLYYRTAADESADEPVVYSYWSDGGSWERATIAALFAARSR